MSGCKVVRVGLSQCLGYWALLHCQLFAPEKFEIVSYMHILWTGFVVYKISGSRIFSGIFRIWKMWMCWVCGVGPQTIFQCIYDFENVGAPGLWDQPRCIFGHFENMDAWVCGSGPRLFSGVFMILKMWVHRVYGTSPRCIFGHYENVDAWVCGENFPALLDAGFLCFNRSRAFQQYQYSHPPANDTLKS